MINVTHQNKQRPFSVDKLRLKLKVNKKKVSSINKNSILSLDIDNCTLNINKDNRNSIFNKQKQKNDYNIIHDINKLKHLNFKYLNNLRSSELKGNYYYDTLNSINSNLNQTKRSYFEEESIPKTDNYRFKKKNQKKFFLTNSTQNILLHSSNIINETTNIKTFHTIEIENYEKNNEDLKYYNKKKSEKLKLNNYSSIEKTLSKKSIEYERIFSPKKIRKDSIVDKLFLKITNPDEYYTLHNSNEKNRDKYIKFKKQIQKKQFQNYKKYRDGRLELIKGMGDIKKYHTKLAWSEYYLKTKYNSNNIKKYKKFIKL